MRSLGGSSGDRRGELVSFLEIKYSDTDAVRAKELTDTLRDVWLEDAIGKLKQNARRLLDDINEEIDLESRLQPELEREIQIFEEQHRINPLDWVGGQTPELSELSRSISELEKTIEDDVADTELRRAKIEKSKAQLALIDPKRRVLEDEGLSKAQRDQLAQAQRILLETEQALGLIEKAHPSYEKFVQRAEVARAVVEKIKSEAGVDTERVVPNEEWVERNRAIEEAEAELAGLERKIARERERLAALVERRDEMPGVATDYRRRRENREVISEKLDALRGRLAVAQERVKDLERKDFEIQEASVAPRPTEPNIWLVALAGSAVGLAVAIGLILLLDVLQSTYKTVEDVEHGLALPVLGGLSHMETLEERRQVSVRRTRTGLVAGAFVLLMVSVITIYYVAPTSLPPFVRDTLFLLLGGPDDVPR